MSGFVLSPAALADLDEIWEYTAERWSIGQAERYVRAIVDACQALADGRRQGVAVDHIRKGYFKLAVGSHLVFYCRPGPAETLVVRVLHHRMDVATRLQ
jgi:toxin ParE1/3/4